jgi:hypothetical protein
MSNALKKCRTIISLFSALLFFSCKPAVHDQKSLIAYIDDQSNGLSKNLNLKNLDAKLTFIPWEMQAYDKTLVHLKVKPATAKLMKENYYFLLSLSKDNKEILKQLPFSEYSEMLQVLAFRMQSYTLAISDTNTKVETSQCLFQQTYGLSRANSVLLIFPKQKFENSKNIKVNIKEFGLRSGDLTFDFKTSDLLELKNISISNQKI